jgi:alkylhydroperoxidase family enzyme
MSPRPLAAFALLLACPSVRAPVAAPPTNTEVRDAAPTASELPPLVPADLRVMRGTQVAGALASDGAITVGGAPYARMEARRVVAADGRVLAALDAQGGIVFEGTSRRGRLLAEGVVEADDGQRMAIGADGRVVFTDPAHAGDDVVLQTRLEGVTERSRREAVVLVAVLMFRERAAAGR